MMREHRHEPVTLAVKVNVLEDLGSVRLEAAVHVVELDPGREPRGRVVDPRDEPSHERIVPIALPARDDVESVVELGEQVRDLGRVVLQVCIHRDDHLAGRDLDSGRERGRLAEVPAQTYDADVEVRRMEAHELAVRAVGRAVVDEHDLPVEVGRAERGVEFGVDLLERRLFVEERDDDGDQAPLWSDIPHRGLVVG